MYAFFLLALLADVARFNLPVSAGGDSTGGLMLSASGQLRVGATSDAVPARRRIDRTLPATAKLKGYRLTFSRWVRAISGRSNASDLSNQVLQAAVETGSDLDSGGCFAYASGSGHLSRSFFEHTGSPAP
jgi:hypothetical protein